MESPGEKHAVVDDDTLRRFLEGLGDALSAGELAKVIDCWAPPALVLTDDGAVPIAERAQLEQMFEGAVGAYQASEIVATKPEIVRTDRLTERLLAVDVRWPYLDAEGNHQGEELSHYMIWVDPEQRPQIRVALSR